MSFIIVGTGRALVCETCPTPEEKPRHETGRFLGHGFARDLRKLARHVGWSRRKGQEGYMDCCPACTKIITHALLPGAALRNW